MEAKALIAIAFGYGAGAWLAIAASRKASHMKQAQRWIGTRGRILESVICNDPGGKTSSFRIRYEFLVGERIEGNTPRVSGVWFWNNREQAAFVARYVPGDEVEVFYDTRNPRNNCLDRTDRSGITAMWVLAFGGIALASLLVWLEMK